MKLSSEIYQKIDYMNHPAFAGLVSHFNYNNDIIEEIIEELDTLYTFIIKSSPTNAVEYFQTSFAALFEKLKNEVLTPITDESFKEIMARVISDTEKETYKQLRFTLDQTKYKYRTLSTQNNENLKTLIEYGCCHIQFSTDEIAGIREIADKLTLESREHYSSKKTWRGARSLTPLSESGTFFTQLLLKYKIDDLLSNYKKTDMTLCSLALDYAHERQTWFKGCYNNSDLPLSTANYFHFDNDINIIKMMIYLTDVNLKNGPFYFVKKSTTLPQSFIKKNISSALDRILARAYKNVTEPLDYYRPMFKDHRQALANLPRALQLTTHFGDDLLSDSPEAKALLENSEILTGKVGSALIFDGYNGIHKGSTVDEGDRLAIQVAFINKGHYTKSRFASKRLREIAPANQLLRQLRPYRLL